ncbi:MAG: CHAT domain-containing protein [Prochlorotrichaceae cyanobacterium]
MKTSLASLWSVSDEGTLGLMTEFYRQLRDRNVKTKAQALRQTQLAMIQGNITVNSGELRGPSFRGGLALPSQIANRETPNLSHPYYWAAFTLVGNPW